MGIEITTDVVRMPELDAGAELGFAVFIGVQASSAADDPTWQALAAQGIDHVGIFAPWRYQNLSLAIGAPGEVPTPAQRIEGPAIAASASIRAQLDALLVERGRLGNTTFALTNADDIDDQDRLAVPRFLAGLAVQPAPFNRVVYQTVLLARAVASSDDGIASIAFDVAGLRVDHPASAGDDVSADGMVARRWDLGVSFEGADVFLLSRVGARQVSAWITPALDHASLYSRQLDTVDGQDPHNAVTAAAGPVFVSGVATEEQAQASAGALLFLRTNGPGETRPWRCLSEAVSHQTRCLAPSPMTLTEVSRGDEKHPHDGVEIAYQGDSLFASSDYEGESEGSGSDREALLPLVDSDSPWSFEPTLGFGFDVQAALLLVGNAGVLPADLQDPDDPTALRTHIDAGGAAFDPPAFATQRYYRRSPVAACLLDTALHTAWPTLGLTAPKPDEDPVLLAEGADLAIHELPPAYFPARIDREPSTPLLLLDGRAPSRSLILRAPATSYSVLDRWLAADERSSAPIPARADYRVAFERLRDVDLEQLPQRERSQLSFCDPAVDSLLIELHEVWPATRRVDSRQVSLRRDEQHRDLADDASLAEQTGNSWSEAVILTIEIGGKQLSMQQDGTRVTIRVPANSCAQLRVYAGVEQQLWTQRCVANLQPTYAPAGANPDHVWLSPRSLLIESADQSLPATADLLQALTLLDEDESVMVKYTAPTIPSAGNVANAKNIREIAVSRQHWRWDGRGVETPPRATKTDWNRRPEQTDSAESSGVLWETSNFIERLNASPVSERCPVPAGEPSITLHRWPKPHHHEDVVRATFVAHHRYAKQLRVEPLEIADNDDHYRRLRLPARSEGPVPQPSLGLMLPLLDGEGDRAAGDMLLVLQEPWYQRGLAEGLQVEVEPIVRDLCPIDDAGVPKCTEIAGEPRCEITERVARAEIGADPILTADVGVPSGELPQLHVAGPFGLTFDRDINSRRQLGAAFTAGGAGAFDFAKLRMRRVLEPSAFAGYSSVPIDRRELSAAEISALASSGNLIIDVRPGEQHATAFPLTIKLDATEIKIEVHNPQIVISIGGHQIAALTRAPLPTPLHRLTLVRQFDLRPDARPGVWSLRLEALVEHRYVTLASAELMLPARADSVTIVLPPGTESAITVAPRYSRWTQGRWTQFWPRRDHLMPDGTKLACLDQALRLVHDAGAWQLRNDEGETQPHGLLAEHDDQGQGRRLFHWLLVTRRVQSSAGSIVSELPKSILEIADPTSFKIARGAEALDPGETDLIARVVLVQRSPMASTASEIWQRLFPRSNPGGIDVDAELRIIGISPRLRGG